MAALGEPVAGEPEAVTSARDLVMSFADPSANPEQLDLPVSAAQVRAALAASPAFGDTPLVVLSAGGTPDEWPRLPPAVSAAWEQAWFAGYRSLATASSAGRVVEVVGSGHMIQLDAPGTIVDAILAMIEGR